MNDIWMAVFFVIVMAILCVAWNKFLSWRQEKSLDEEAQFIKEHLYKGCLGNIDLSLAGVSADGNSDNKFEEVVTGIALPENVRVKLYD